MVVVLAGVGIAFAAGVDQGGHARGDGVGRTPSASVNYSPTPDEAVFTPIMPCRIVNTRAKGGEVSAARSFYVGGAGDFAGQGGTTGGCGIPASATAVAANVVAVGGAKSGYAQAYPAGSAALAASIINFNTATIANSLPLAIRPGTAQALTVSASTPTHIIIDVTGYYAPQLVASVGPSGFFGSGTTSRFQSVSESPTGTFTLIADRNLANCAATVTASGGRGAYAGASTNSDGSLTVHTWVLVGSSTTPVAAGLGFSVLVTC